MGVYDRKNTQKEEIYHGGIDGREERIFIGKERTYGENRNKLHTESEMHTEREYIQHGEIGGVKKEEGRALMDRKKMSLGDTNGKDIRLKGKKRKYTQWRKRRHWF